MTRSPTPLDDEQIMAEVLNMIVRNNLEDLHAGEGEISDALMKKLNRRVRNGIYTGLHALKWQRPSISADRFVDYHLRSIPSYWEAPELIPGYRDSLEPETDGARPTAIDAASSDYNVAVRAVRAMLGRISATREGRGIRGPHGAALRRRMVRFGIDRYLKLTSKQRHEAGRLSYLEADLAARIQVLAERRSRKESDGA
jgi:hypothetical protein